MHEGLGLVGSRAEGARREFGVREDLRGRCRGAAANSTDNELQQTLLGAWSQSTSRFNVVRLQSQHGHLSTGKINLKKIIITVF